MWYHFVLSLSLILSGFWDSFFEKKGGGGLVILLFIYISCIELLHLISTSRFCPQRMFSLLNICVVWLTSKLICCQDIEQLILLPKEVVTDNEVFIVD